MGAIWVIGVLYVLIAPAFLIGCVCGHGLAKPQ